ncbi:WYL domain-containing protein [Acidovorax sp. Leaf160]|uniref:WYL domain-containing protein n=1 Tax=Acidovorax sp. Leaf160 TaxID=1736280 RepID=UPI001F3293E9|nr:WYL domain-containing protein [Acidovorax sp. Leaf160]
MPIAQQERLLYIDMKLRFLGEVRRQDLIQRFGIQTAAATRDLALYRWEKPDNLVFVSKTKSYVRGEKFKPLYDTVTSADALAWLSPAKSETGLLDSEVRLHVERPLAEKELSPDTVAAITRAIKSGTSLSLAYRSPIEGTSSRSVVPHALADIQGNWLLRVFDRSIGDFNSLRLSWIQDATLVIDEIRGHERSQDDSAWHTIRTLELVPHPDNVAHPECLVAAAEQSLTSWRVEVREALIDAWLQGMRVDSTRGHRLRGDEYLWWLKSAHSVAPAEYVSVELNFRAKRF